MTWVVAYDVSVDRNRNKVAKLLEAKGLRLQYSVFLVQGAPRGVCHLLEELAKLIDRRTDRLCAWPLIEAWRTQQICFPAEAAPLSEEFVVA